MLLSLELNKKLSLLKESNKLITIFLLILLTLTSSSCSDKIEKNNENFLAQYGSQVDKINRNRQRVVRDKRSDYLNPLKGEVFTWKSPAELIGIESIESLKQADFEVPNPDPKELKSNRQTYFPDFNRVKEIKKRNQAPDIFTIHYPQTNYPSSYRKKGVSFDDINIPQHDYFGVKSRLDPKSYNMIDHRILQENVDYLHQHLTSDKKEIYAKLLEERKKIRKQKYAQIFLGKEEKVEQKTKLEDVVDDAIDKVSETIDKIKDLGGNIIGKNETKTKFEQNNVPLETNNVTPAPPGLPSPF